jgi:hypothetical protein
VDRLDGNIRERFIGYMKMAFPHLDSDPEKLANTIAAAKRGAVLLLGPDSGDAIARLHEIRDILETRVGLTALLVKEQPEMEGHGLVGKLHVYAGMARFVVVENSGPSGHLYELPHLRMIESVTAVLQETGKGASRMPDDSIAKDPLVRVFRYSTQNLEATVVKAAMWAERRIEKNAQQNRKTWGWTASAQESPNG